MKKNTYFKLIFAVMLSIIMAITILPMSIFAAKEMFMSCDYIGIRNCAIPVAGEKPDFNVDENSPGKYEIKSINWYKGSVSASNAVGSTETFQANTVYIVEFEVWTKGSYYFTTDSNGYTTVTADLSERNAEYGEFDAQVMNVYGKDNSKYLTVRYAFPATKGNSGEITSVGVINIEAPVAGKVPDTTGAVVDTGKYEIKSIVWKQQYSDTTFGSNTTFGYGTVYEVRITLRAKDGYYFKTELGMPVVSAAINGKMANASGSAIYEQGASEYIDIVMSFQATEAKTIINDVAVTNLTAPVSGATPDFSADTPANSGYRVSNIRWCKAGSSKDMTASDKFESGQRYYAFIEITSESGYGFWAYNYMKGTVNGTKAQGFNADGTQSKVTMFAEFTATGDAVIYNIEVKDVVAPVAGGSINYTVNFGSNGYEMDKSYHDSTYYYGVSWRVDGGIYLPTGTGKFDSNETYQIVIRLKAADGYKFDADDNGNTHMTATVNGKTAVVKSNKTEAIVTYTFPKTGNTSISKVDVTDIDAPVTSNSPDYVASYGNANYGAANYNDKNNKNGISWYNETDKKTMSTTDKFEAGKSYTAQIIIWTNDDCEFAYKSGSVNVTATVNGDSADVTSRSKEEVTLYYTFPKTEEHNHSPKKIDEVKATCKEEGKKSYYFCPECGKNFEDSKCTKEITDINAWGVIPKTEHTGGKATCDNRAICKNCGEWYGEFAEHKFGTGWDYKDETGHAHKCKECGFVDTIVPHSGGTAKCGEVAKCEECKAEYGEVKQHQWSENFEYTDKNGHAHKCTVCGEHDTIVPHSGGTADCKNKAKCTDCGTEYGKTGDHKWSTAWDYSDKKGHAHKCTVCGEHDEVVKHTPGAAATETTAQICTACNYTITPATNHKHKLVRVDAVKATCTDAGREAYYYCQSCDSIFTNNTGGEEITDSDSLIIAATGHKESKWKYDEDIHWKECTVKGCGVIIDGTNEGHDFSDKDKCTVCGYKRGDVIVEDTAQSEDDTNEPGSADSSDGKVTSPDSSQSSDTSDGTKEQDDNKFMWIIVAAVAVAVICVALTAVVLVKKKGKK